MDYSLLIGVVRRNFEVLSELLSDHELGNASAEYNRTSMSNVSSAHDVRMESVQSLDSDGSYRTPSRPVEFSGSGISFETVLKGGVNVEVVEAPGTYYIGLIDILQEWNFSKKLERLYKIYFRALDGAGISAIEPIQYQKRFMQRVIRDVFDGLNDEFTGNPTTLQILSEGKNDCAPKFLTLADIRETL
jgi:1-phosphatidylinositol-4-phosphate 5-kinase